MTKLSTRRANELAWQRMSGRAKIVSWCSLERDYYTRVCSSLPWDNILVELEKGPLFVSNPIGFTWRDIQANMPVNLTFSDCEDSHGTFKLPVFARA